MVNDGNMYVDVWQEFNEDPFEFDYAEFYAICKEYNDFLVDSMFRLVSMTPNERMPDYYHEMRLIAVRLRQYNILLNKLVNRGRMSGTDYAFMRAANGWEKRFIRLSE